MNDLANPELATTTRVKYDDNDAVASAWAAWWRAARWRFLSLHGDMVGEEEEDGRREQLREQGIMVHQGGQGAVELNLGNATTGSQVQYCFTT